MHRKSVMTMGFAAVAWLAILGGRALSAAGQLRGGRAWRVGLLRVPRLRKLGDDLDQPDREGDGGDRRQPGDDRRLSRRYSGERPARPGWGEDGQGALESEAEPVLPDRERAEYFLNVDLMVKDSKRFGDVGGWGYAVFDYQPESDSFTPGTTAGTPPQGNDAKCGVACAHDRQVQRLRVHQVRQALNPRPLPSPRLRGPPQRARRQLTPFSPPPVITGLPARPVF